MRAARCGGRAGRRRRRRRQQASSELRLMQDAVQQLQGEAQALSRTVRHPS